MQRDALAAGDLEVHAGEQRPLAEGLADALERQHLVAEKFAAPELRGHLLLARGLVRRAHPLDALFHRKRALVQRVVAHERPQVQFVRCGLELPDLGLLLLILPHFLQIAALLLHGVEAVVAVVELRVAVQNLDDAGDGAVQEIAVVRDGDDRALERGKVFLQPLDGVEVEVVGRLVEQQNVRVLQNQAAEVHARLFAAGERVEQPRAHIRGNGQAVGHLIDGGGGVVAAEALEAGGQLAVAAQRLLGFVALRHLRGEPLHFVGHAPHALEGGLQHVLHRIARRVHRYLRDQPDAAVPTRWQPRRRRSRSRP